MAISPVSFGSNTTQAATATKKKMDPVKKGALIGASLAVAHNCASIGGNIYGARDMMKTAFKQSPAGAIIGGIIGLALEAGILAGIGAGIGKLVKNHQAKKAEKAAGLDKQA